MRAKATGGNPMFKYLFLSHVSPPKGSGSRADSQSSSFPATRSNTTQRREAPDQEPDSILDSRKSRHRSGSKWNPLTNHSIFPWHNKASGQAKPLPGRTTVSPHLDLQLESPRGAFYRTLPRRFQPLRLQFSGWPRAWTILNLPGDSSMQLRCDQPGVIPDTKNSTAPLKLLL